MLELVYLAYGSNLHPARLRDRVPSARPLGAVGLPGYRLAFHKRSVDGSAKCDLVCTDDPRDRAWGALHRMESRHKTALDRAEGAGHGYRELRLSVQLDGRPVECFTYLAEPGHIEPGLKPYHWYKALVLVGAEYWAMPAQHLRFIESVPSMDDPDPLERGRYERLVDHLRSIRAG